MPEGPEVLHIALELNDALKGLFITSIDISMLNRTRSLEKLKMPAYIVGVSYYGKRLVFLLKDSEGKEVFIASFLAMEGHWGWDSKRNHMVLTMTIGERLSEEHQIFLYNRELYYDDSRHFGMTELLETQEDYHKYFLNTGYDLLIESSKITQGYWYTLLRTPRIHNKQICDFLISQKYISGIGNYLKSTILYRSRVKPDRTLSSLTVEEIETLRIHSLNTIVEAFHSCGLTISSFSTPNGKKGTFNSEVYNKTHDPYGNLVIREKFKDGRTTHWVPGVQV